MVERLLPKILVVDDERNVHYSFRRLLGNEYEVISAFSGEEALSRVAEDLPHLVLLDVRLPGQNGLDILKKLKALKPELPVIIMTAFGTAETAIRATKLEADDYVLKPFDVSAFKQLIAKTLERKAAFLRNRFRRQAQGAHAAVTGNGSGVRNERGTKQRGGGKQHPEAAPAGRGEREWRRKQRQAAARGHVRAPEGKRLGAVRRPRCVTGPNPL